MAVADLPLHPSRHARELAFHHGHVTQRSGNGPKRKSRPSAQPTLTDQRKDFAVKIEWEPHGSTPANVSIYLLVFRGDLNRGWENDDAKIVENNIDCWQYVVLGDRFMQIKVTPDWAPKVAPKVAK